MKAKRRTSPDGSFGASAVRPRGLHEVKFDGWRAQLHKSGDEVTIYTRNGYDYTKRFPSIRIASSRFLQIQP
jgi:ATP-dependent DNA ligase